MEEAQFLTKFASKVTLLHRRDELRASQIMQKRTLGNPKVAVMWSTVLDKVLGDKVVEGVMVKNVKTGDITTLDDVTGVFLAIGHKPNTDLFKEVLDMDETGYIKTMPRSTYTNMPGIFACGDAQDKDYRQAVTAAGTGCMAAIDAERWLAEQE